LNQKDSAPVIIDYYYKGMRTKVSTSVVCQIKDWDDNWNEDIVRTSVANQKLAIEGEHPAPFPEEIITLPILQTSKEFELALDPFMGSGTTGRVCDKLGRSFVGYDLRKFNKLEKNKIIKYEIID
jgi:DNA modification methylase